MDICLYIRNIFTITVFTVLIFGCNAQNVRKHSVDFESSFYQGQIVSNHVVIGNKQIPIPEGDWEVASVKEARQKVTFLGGSLMTAPDIQSNSGQLALVKIKDNQLYSAVYISARSSVVTPGNYMKLHKNCNTKAPHYREVESSKAGGEHDCYIVYQTNQSAEKLATKDSMSKAVEWLAAKKGIKMDLNGPLIQHFVTKDDDYVLYQHYVSPALDQRGKKKASWKYDSWAKPITDPHKSSYINRIIQDGKLLHSRIAASLDGSKMSVSKQERPLKVIHLRQNDRPEANHDNSDIEDKLRKLKDLHEQGLITDEEYKSQKMEILKTMK